jgi:hypothetical protein
VLNGNEISVNGKCANSILSQWKGSPQEIMPNSVPKGLEIIHAIASPAVRIKALTSAIEKCGDLGLYRRVRPLAKEAFDLIPQVSDSHSRGSATAPLLELLTALHLDDFAQEQVASIPNPGVRLQAFGSLAVVWAKKGCLSKALPLVNAIKENSEAGDALREVAVALVARGQLREAGSLAIAMRGGTYKRDAVFTSIIEAMIQSEAYPDAANLARSAPQGSDAPVRIAKAMVKAGDSSGAVEFARSIGNDNRRAEALSYIARALARSGDLKRAEAATVEARAAAEKLPYDEAGRASARIAAGLAELRRYEQSRESAERCHLPRERLWAYTAIVRADLAHCRSEFAEPMNAILTAEI